MWKKVFCVITALIILTGMIAGCGSKTEGQADIAAISDAAKPVSDEMYIGVYCLGNLEYFYDHKIGLESAGKMMGVKTKYVGPPDYDINAMVTAFEQAIAEKPAGIITFGAEDSLLPVINKAVEAEKPDVLIMDGDFFNGNTKDAVISSKRETISKTTNK